MRKYITLFFSVSLFLFSCSKDKTPSGVIDHDKMTNLLTEVHLIDGRSYGFNNTADSVKKYGRSLYVALFKRYRTDSAQFNKSLKYYATQPVELQKMYDQILLNLKAKTDSLNKLQLNKSNTKRPYNRHVVPR